MTSQNRGPFPAASGLNPTTELVVTTAAAASTTAVTEVNNGRRTCGVVAFCPASSAVPKITRKMRSPRKPQEQFLSVMPTVFGCGEIPNFPPADKTALMEAESPLRKPASRLQIRIFSTRVFLRRRQTRRQRPQLLRRRNVRHIKRKSGKPGLQAKSNTRPLAGN